MDLERRIHFEVSNTLLTIKDRNEDAFISEELVKDKYAHLDRNKFNERWREYKRTGDPKIREDLLNRNLRLVWGRAHRYSRGAMGVSELICVGTVGLDKALDSYDENKGSFGNYARYWINQAMLRSISSETRTIRISPHIAGKINRVRKFVTKYYGKNGELPIVREVLDRCKVSEGVIGVFEGEYGNTISFDAGNDGEDLYDTFDKGKSNGGSSFLDKFADRDLSERITRIVWDLFREGRIREKEFESFLRHNPLEGDWETLEEISEDFDCTRESIRQSEEKVVKLIKRRLRLQKILNNPTAIK